MGAGVGREATSIQEATCWPCSRAECSGFTKTRLPRASASVTRTGTWLAESKRIPSGLTRVVHLVKHSNLNYSQVTVAMRTDQMKRCSEDTIAGMQDSINLIQLTEPMI